MKITIWEQFSSNHSAMYTVVGMLDTPEDATQAGEIVQKMVVDIVDWYDQHRSAGKIFEDQESPIEKESAQKYTFDWKESVDWLVKFPRYFLEPIQQEPAEHIYIYDRMVIVDAPGGSSTSQTGHQFERLINALGGQPYSKIYEGYDDNLEKYVFQNLTANIQCHIPHQGLCTQIKNEIQNHITDQEQLIPWIIYHPDLTRLMGNIDTDRLIEYE